ncbi:MAG: hypothetical protein ACFFG0_23970 [Candidatus Thorarchaeota archaeon]
MKDSTRSSLFIVGIGLFIMAFGAILLSLVITQWDDWIPQLELTGMSVLIIVSVILIIIGLFLTIKFII